MRSCVVPLAALAALFQLACAGDDPRTPVPEDPNAGAPVIANVGSTLSLSLGQAGGYRELDLELVATDLVESRCPTGVTCVWSGDAAVTVVATVGDATETFELHTATNLDQSTVTQNGITVTLVDVSPYPAEGEAIARDAYVVTLQATPSSDS